MLVQTKTVNGTEAFTFSEKCAKFLVKNFSRNDILVSFSSDMPANGSAKIKKGMGQVVVDNEWLAGLPPYTHDTIYIRGYGEVEVQAICHR